MTRVEPVEYGNGNYVEHSARRGKLEKGRTRRSIVIWAPAVLCCKIFGISEATPRGERPPSPSLLCLSSS